jgi:hypothetical protein
MLPCLYEKVEMEISELSMKCKDEGRLFAFMQDKAEGREGICKSEYVPVSLGICIVSARVWSLQLGKID